MLNIEFIFMPLTLIQYHESYERLLSTYLSVTSSSNSKRTDFHYPPFTYLFLKFHYVCIAISELLIHTLVRNNFSN